MITWNNILSQYQFQNPSYEEHCDPSDLKNYFVEVIPKYPFQALTVSVILTHISSHHTGRQHIYLSNIHNFLSLYNHSDFIKVHMHNDWLLGKIDLTIDLPADFFVSSKHLFIFCGR